MESEERPAKLRKLHHGTGVGNAEKGDPPSSLGKVGDSNGSSVEEPPFTATETMETDATLNEENEGDNSAPKLSKNQLKKQRRLEKWESGREDRKVKRKEKIKAKKERRRQAWEESRAEGSTVRAPLSRPPRRGDPVGTQVPITIIFDCDFDDFMHDHELKSLGLQITRSYSDNRKAPFRFHMAISSWGGKLRERFDGVLAKQYTSWKGFRFLEEDFVKVGELSKDWMKGPQGGTISGALATGNQAEDGEEKGSEEEGEVVYLSAESENTLERLKPNSTYIIGGLVDKNRHKGLCNKRALNRGIKTAKLPIGEFLQMKSRQVLVTNHVLEIMLRWLEFDDWGKAFMEVLPKRKGGMLKNSGDDGDAEERGTPEEDEDEEVQAQAEGHDGMSKKDIVEQAEE